jgi:hypothetical protein
MNFFKLASFVTLFAAMIAVGSASAVCSNASFMGSYGSLEYGGNGQYGVTLTHFLADGNGHVSGTVTNSIGGIITTSAFTGTYSVSAKCTGSYNVNFPSSTESGYFVIDHAKKGLEILRTDNGFTKSGWALAQGMAPCGLTGRKQTLAANLAGSGGVHPVASVGQITLSGTGKLSGSATISIGGTIATFPVTGSYTVNADCTGTAQITLTGLSTSNYNVVAVNSSNEILMIETDNDTIVSGVIAQ